MKILQVSWGRIPIPPQGWGGAENILWQQHGFLQRSGVDATIYNERLGFLTALRARPWRYDASHLHFDVGAKYWVPLQRALGFRLVITSHYGYSAFPDLWSPHHRKTFRRMLPAPYHITLSHEIRNLMLERGYSGKVWVLPNGIETADVRFNPNPGWKQSLVLGRVQERKKQRYLADILAGEPVTLDLIGPTDEPDFTGNGDNVRYLGPWDRDQVQSDLTQYAAMVLISDGEAHAGVILEAMAAGLSLVISRESAHNLDCDQPWIHVVDREKPDDMRTALKQAVAENPRYRTAIRRYCERTFDWDVIGPRYRRILDAIVHGDGTDNGGEPFEYLS